MHLPCFGADAPPLCSRRYRSIVTTAAARGDALQLQSNRTSGAGPSPWISSPRAAFSAQKSGWFVSFNNSHVLVFSSETHFGASLESVGCEWISGKFMGQSYRYPSPILGPTGK